AQRIRIRPAFRRCGSGTEFADRAAQVQLRHSAQRERGGSRAAVPVPGGDGILMAPRHGRRTRRQTFLRCVMQGLVAVALLASTGVAGAVEYKIGFVNTERLFWEATPAKRAQAKIE